MTLRNPKGTVNDLGEWNSERNMRKSALYRDMQREIRRGFPANVKLLYIGQESNRMPVLNSAAARLGQAYRETSDALQRDNLEATASVVNSVGGSNGRFAVLKSDLIEVELLAA